MDVMNVQWSKESRLCEGNYSYKDYFLRELLCIRHL